MRMKGSAFLVISCLALPAFAREEPDVCPGTFHFGPEHPACPPPATLAWVDCPHRWPLDPSKRLLFAPLFYEFSFDWPDVERDNLERHPEGAQLFCEYGSDSERHLYRLIVEVPGPISQWGWHKTPEGDVVGCRVPKALAAKPPVTHLIEPITRNVALLGFRLGMTADQVRQRAASEGFSTHEAGSARLALSRASQRLEIGFGKTGRVREIIQALGEMGHSDQEKALVLRFGLVRDLWPLKPDEPKYMNWHKVVWASRDRTVAVEYHPETKFGDPPALHLVDLRP
ncbi:hypothetical protein [Magnetospirillum sp. UT-4]|uniref:hypothetical protein n=1 Tax=Magnetospirillum sp. UT-4 TaxID=2681467 RepID=UPI00138166A6|nr:hypothetical protein [Magnetospirillum sp. UT-4]CAA7626073.1 exported hypothetical protein [Magnetospirillum sp. UT-4]